MPSLVSHAKNQTSAAITEAENRTSEGPFGRQMAYEFGAKWIYEFASTADFEGHGICSVPSTQKTGVHRHLRCSVGCSLGGKCGSDNGFEIHGDGEVCQLCPGHAKTLLWATTIPPPASLSDLTTTMRANVGC